MIAYNKTWLSNLLLWNKVARDQQQGLITDQEVGTIHGRYPVGFYYPNSFIRAGLFVLTIVMSVFGSGLVSLLFAEAGFVDTFGWLFFLGIAHYGFLEIKIKTDHHFRSGVDDALLWIGTALVIAGLVIAGINERPVLMSAIILFLSGLLSLRFADAVMALLAYLSALAFVFFSWKAVGPIGVATMPFLLMTFSSFVYLLTRKYVAHPKSAFYQNSFVLNQIACLFSLYASGNYFVVKELGDSLNGTVSESIPFGWFFWGWTIFLPLTYIGIGIKQRNVILMRTGLVLIAAAAGTYKNYYKLMPIEWTLILAGAFALILSYLLTRYLNSSKYGFTRKELSKEGLMEELQVESIITSESFADVGMAPTGVDERFGGGNFGGGGSGGGF